MIGQRVRLADPLLTADTVASLVGVHVDTIYKWIAKGDLPAVKISRRVMRVRGTALQAFLTSRTRRVAGRSAS